jgi:hypothetical protein
MIALDDKNPKALKLDDGVHCTTGEMGPEFTVMGGTRYGGSALGDETISSILSAAQLPLEKRPDFICHHFASWNALLWIRWVDVNWWMLIGCFLVRIQYFAIL